jgi:Arc/MetJ family transcription regulator
VAAKKKTARTVKGLKTPPASETLDEKGQYRRPRGRPAMVREGWERKEFLLDPRLLNEAKAHFGVATEREAVELALEAVSFKAKLLRSIEALRHIEFDDPEVW